MSDLCYCGNAKEASVHDPAVQPYSGHEYKSRRSTASARPLREALAHWDRYSDEYMLLGAWRVSDLREYQAICRKADAEGWEWPAPPMPYTPREALDVEQLGKAITEVLSKTSATAWIGLDQPYLDEIGARIAHKYAALAVDAR